MRHTVRAIILKDKSVLLVTGHGADFYWTPGGGIEHGESVVEALHREIKEELGAGINSYTPYYSYIYEDQKVDSYIVAIDNDVKISSEITDYAWFSSASDINPSRGFITILMPKLMEDNLVE